MYQLLGDEVFDSKEMGNLLQGKTAYILEEDMTKRTKREDALAFKMSISVDMLELGLPRFIEDEELLNKLFTISDGLFQERLTASGGLNPQLETKIYSYGYDEVDHKVLAVVGIMDKGNATRKLPDVMKRLLTQV